jgi:gamma-glutamylcysteine synthetase
MTAEETRKNPEGKAGNGGAEVLAAGGGNLEKIREILFGAQVHDFEKRFTRLEEKLLKETSDARAETKKRFDSMEAFIRKEIESLVDRVKTEQGERSDAIKEISRDLRETAKNLDKKLVQLDEQATKGQRELRQQILDQSKSLSDEIRNRVKESAAVLTRELRELRTEKTDRAALAGLFTEAAMRLSGDMKPSAKE